ncbi:hypothetical protein K438DRAFT_1575412 [Mycena galopus ATCC 62051]|nr:hypothetical protein K438DRAFT_1575412 [Mycena galopus ATCC 62051]
MLCSFLQFRLQYSSLAFLYYDFALTFPKEVKYIWGQQFRLSTALYIGCRYALVANMLYLLAIADELGSTVCNVWYKIIGALSVIGRAAVIAFFTMRTYAVYGKNAWVLAYMSVVGLACVALDITHVPGLRCVGSSSLPMYVAIPILSTDAPEMLSILMVIFESSSAFLTAVRCVMAFRAGELANKRQSILFILFEQGIYLHDNFNIFKPNIISLRDPPGFFQRLPNAFTLPLSCILTARFILFLRRWDEDQVAGGHDQDAHSDISEAEFRPGTAISRSVISTIISMDDFGPDPVALATRPPKKGREKHDVQEVHAESDAVSTEFWDVGEGSTSSGRRGQNVKFQKVPVELV